MTVSSVSSKLRPFKVHAAAQARQPHRQASKSPQQAEVYSCTTCIMASPLRAEAEKALRTLQAALDAVERARPGAAAPAAPPAADCLTAAAQRVSQEVAKCAVMFGMGGLGSDKAASLLGALCAAVRAFSAQCGAVATAGGATLRV